MSATAESIARALGGTKTAGGWKAKCPAHRDDTPSLALSDGDDGRLLVYCHGGCAQADVIAALGKLGLWPNGKRTVQQSPPPVAKTEKTPIVPVPADAPPMTFKHPRYGSPSRTWPYHLADGGLAGYAARFDFRKADGTPSKDVLPVTFCDLGNGKRGWRSKGIPEPRPLYRLPELLARSDAPILVTEGEKARDAAQRLLPEYVVTTPMHGAKSPAKTDWTPVRNRTLTIWPDHDQPGADFAQMVAELADEAGAASVAIADVPADFPEGWDLADDLPAGWTIEGLHALLEAAPAWQAKAAEPLPNSRRPAIRCMGGDLADATAAALRVLASERDPLQTVYVRGSMLVRPMRLEDRLSAGGVKRPMNAFSLRLVDADWLALRLAELADWYKVADLKMKPVDPPERVCRSVLAAAPWQGLPPLTGVIEAPTIRPDGSLLTTPGYDSVTGLLFDAGGTRFPAIPEKPTRADAEAAIEVLKRPFVAFPFVGEADRSVALSSVLTVLVCRMLRAAPLFGYSAPKMASGKTLLATIASYVGCGRAPYLMSQAQDPADERKRMLSALIEGPAMLVIDNIERALQSDALCTAITEATYNDRVLGQSRTVTVETNCLFAATGNNLALAGDLTARAILCRLDPACERPEQRTFDLNLHEWVPAHRGELAVAALTVIRAYLAAGEPRQPVPNFARFEEWQRLCRFPLTWLGLADPCETRESIEATDPVRENLRALLTTWHEHFSDRPATVAQAIAAGTNARNKGGDILSFTGDGLNEAMMAVAGEKGSVNSRRLGRFIGKHERRIEGDLRFLRAGTADKTMLWRVSGEGFQGFQGFSFCPSREKGNGKAHESAEGIFGDRHERNPENPLNPAASVEREVDL